MEAVLQFIRDLFVSFGGGIGVATVVLLFAKGIFQKWIEKTIDKTTEKSLAKYTNALQRKTTAFDILLQKELSFYEDATEFISKLIVDINDFVYYLDDYKRNNNLKNKSKVPQVALKILETVPKFEHDYLMALCYIPPHLGEYCEKLTEDLRDSFKIYTEICDLVRDDNINDEIFKKVMEEKNLTLNNCVELNSMISERLKGLSEE